MSCHMSRVCMVVFPPHCSSKMTRMMLKRCLTRESLTVVRTMRRMERRRRRKKMKRMVGVHLFYVTFKIALLLCSLVFLQLKVLCICRRQYYLFVLLIINLPTWHSFPVMLKRKTHVSAIINWCKTKSLSVHSFIWCGCIFKKSCLLNAYSIYVNHISLGEDEEEDEKAEEGAFGGTSADLAGMSSDEDIDKCPICLNSFSSQPVATPENCEHYFCLDCILEWAKVGWN